MSETEMEVLKYLPAIDINVGDERARFVQKMVSIAQSERGMVVELYQDALGQEGIHFANFLLPGSSEDVRSGGQLIVRPDEARVCVEMRSGRWTSGYPTRSEYVEFSREVFSPLLSHYNKEFGTHHRMRVERPPPSYQLPPKASRLFERFAILANTRSLHPLDWDRFYLFVRNSRQQVPEGALRSLLISRGFPAATAQMLSDLYHHLWSFKKLKA
jgi:hypothetical protein